VSCRPATIMRTCRPWGLTTDGEGIEGARVAAKELVTLWLSEKKAAGESFGLPSEFFFSTIEISESALQSA
jgi:hypothetical protein